MNTQPAFINNQGQVVYYPTSDTNERIILTDRETGEPYYLTAGGDKVWVE